MYIKNNDLKLLQEIEIELWNKNSDLYIHLYNLNERLLKQKDKTNKNNYERIKNKRKINKNYARKNLK